jgi:hypothetical protein
MESELVWEVLDLHIVDEAIPTNEICFSGVGLRHRLGHWFENHN